MQAGNWGPPPNLNPAFNHLKPQWNPQAFAKAAGTASPKIKALLDNIERLDREDMANHGTLFKHYIFSDVDAQDYGSRIVISALLAHGFRNMIPTMRRVEPSSMNDEPRRKTFAFLHTFPVPVGGAKRSFDDSVRVFGSEDPETNRLVYSRADAVPLMLDKNKRITLVGKEKEYRLPMKKYVLAAFNDPGNNHGQHVRFIVLSQRFKEGIDLKDVKYAHLFDPLPPTEAKQAIGRGTRFCGQENLKFVAGVGWQLHVYHYLQNIPKALADKHGWSEKHEDLLAKYRPNSDDENASLITSFKSLMQCRSINLPLSALLEQQTQA